MTDPELLVEELFGKALELPPQERPAFLEEACRDRSEIRRKVEWLLFQNQRAGSFLEQPVYAPADSHPRFVAGQVIADRFLIVRFVARGGMGEVYEAQDKLLQGASVALKIIRPEIAADTAISARFQQEVVLARKVIHPNLCPIYEIFDCHHPAPAFLFLSMRLLGGQTLHARLAEKKKLDAEDAVSVCKQLVAGVSALHDSGVIHRDLKPNNVMLEGEGPDTHVSIMDFGLARLNEMEHSLPGTAWIAGTPGYLAPELLSGAKPNKASDLYALGMVLGEVLTGSQPSVTSAGPSRETLSALRAVRAPAASIAKAVVGLLSFDPEMRIRSFASLTKRTGQSNDTRPWRGWVAGSATIIVALATATFVWLRQPATSILLEPRLVKSLAWAPALSRDGKMLAYASSVGGDPEHIWIQQTAGHDTIQVTRGPESQEQPEFSPDGTRIAFYSPGKQRGIFVIPALSGEPRFVTNTRDVVESRFSPRGDSILYWQDLKLFTIPVEGGEPSSLKVNQSFRVSGAPFWAPDGKRILLCGEPGSATVKAPTWWIVPFEGNPKPANLPGVARNGVLGWIRTAGNREWIVYFTAGPEDWKIWRRSVSRGDVINETPELLTSGNGHLEEGSVSDDGKIAYTLINFGSSVFRISLDSQGRKVGPTVQLAFPEGGSYTSPSLTRDGKLLAYNAYRPGKPNTFLLKNLENGGEKIVDEMDGIRGALVEDSGISVSPDGSRILFEREGKQGRWPDNIESPFPDSFMALSQAGSPRKVCENCSPRGFSSDSSVALFQKYDPTSSHRDRIISIDLRTDVQRDFLSDPVHSLYHPFYSWDNRWVVFKRVHRGGSDILIAPVRNGIPAGQAEWIAVTDGEHADDKPQFSADGNTLYFTSTRDGYLCIWAQRLDGVTKRPLGKPFAFEHFHNAEGRSAAFFDLLPNLTVARDKMLISLPHRETEIWLTQMQ
jgi:Tol biopolymer transport system component